VARARGKGHEEEEHANHERWLVSYADMMTLLMVLFIVMFAISQVDQRRFEMLKDGMAAGFGATASPFQGSEAPMDAQGVSPLAPIAPDAATTQPQDVDVRNASSKSSRASATEPAYDEARREVNRLQALRKRIEKALAAKGFLRDVSIKIDERGLAISLVSRHIVFAANEASLSPRGERLLDVLAPVIRSLPNAVEVDGHTNQVKVKPKYYPTDWELSSSRAVTVLRHLNEHGRVPARRMTAVAYGHERPLRDPALPGAAALNKRVDVVVVSAAPENTRKLFAQVLRDHRNRT
jgi:chemotaxis protein MotB